MLCNVADRTLLRIYLWPAKIRIQQFGFCSNLSSEVKALQMKTK